MAEYWKDTVHLDLAIYEFRLVVASRPLDDGQRVLSFSANDMRLLRQYDGSTFGKYDVSIHQRSWLEPLSFIGAKLL